MKSVIPQMALLAIIASGCVEQQEPVAPLIEVRESANSHTPAPSTVTVAGSLQSELGCSDDWDPSCSLTHLALEDDVWQGTFDVPAGAWEYKAPLNDSWDENYGANATQDGPNLALNLAEAAAVKFFYSHATHWITSSRNAVIATAVGSFQSEVGCAGDWQPDCLRSWLQDPDGDGAYSFSTMTIPPGSYEAKVAINEGWDENYGAEGVRNGVNIAFTVGTSGGAITFSYDAATHILTIIGGVQPPPDPDVIDIDMASVINLSRRVVPVVVYGSATFDVSTIDVTTIRFGPAGASERHDLTDPAVLAAHVQDLNADGMMDLVTHFNPVQAGLTTSTTEACVSLRNTGGAPFAGCDVVVVRSK